MKQRLQQLSDDLLSARREAEKWKRKWESGQESIAALDKTIKGHIEHIESLKKSLKDSEDEIARLLVTLDEMAAELKEAKRVIAENLW